MINSLQDTVTLNNDVKMPGFGLGVFQIPEDQTSQIVKDGIINGYRLIDTAYIYQNEVGTGQGIKQGLEATGLDRSDLFITTKLWNKDLNYDQTIEAFNQSLEKLQLDYLDLYLIHWPGQGSFKENWQAMEELYESGKVKAIGVSNFQEHHLEELMSFAKVTPVINQIETHPSLAQKELRAANEKYGIKTEAWSPLAHGLLFDNPLIKDLADKYKKTPVQILLRWQIQKDTVVITKSVSEKRLIENADIFDFEIDEIDMARMEQLDDGTRVGPDPDTYNFRA